jgi:hypothetical protein
VVNRQDGICRSCLSDAFLTAFACPSSNLLLTTMIISYLVPRLHSAVRPTFRGASFVRNLNTSPPRPFTSRHLQFAKHNLTLFSNGFKKRGIATETEIITRPTREEAWKRYAITAVSEYSIILCDPEFINCFTGNYWRDRRSCSVFLESRNTRWIISL